MKVQYDCHFIKMQIGASEQIPWERLPNMQLSDVVHGEKPRLTTSAKACWTKDALWIRFVCEDDHVYATYTNRDDPLYNQDVVEVFIDERGTGRKYVELEISPNNVVFDAIVTNDGTGRVNELDLEWNAEGLATYVAECGGGRTFVIKLPFSNFDSVPVPGGKWSWNLYRIDYDPQGNPHYWAWSPTGAVDFHLSERFGVLHFVEG